MVPFQGEVHRLCVSLYRYNTLSMRGAWERGARYNVRNYFGALYTSLEVETARAEMRRYFTIEPDRGFVWAVIKVKLTRIVDLAERRRLPQLGIRATDLTGDSYTVSQELGLRAWESGIEGLMVPSAAVPGAKNLVIFLDNQRLHWTVLLRALAEHTAPILPMRSSPVPRRHESN
jgi:RES domain-containing protein